jgi:hypothetical protein
LAVVMEKDEDQRDQGPDNAIFPCAGKSDAHVGGRVRPMWVRSAFWIGQPRAGEEQSFRDAIGTELVRAFGALPGVQDVKALWPRNREDDPPRIWCQFLVMFGSRDRMDLMLASAERAALRPRVREVAGLFDGAVSHIDYETD